MLLTDHARTATTELIAAIIPEAVLCCRDVNTRCRQTAYQLLTKMSDQAAERSGQQGYMEAIMAGLAGSQHLASCSLLALAAVMHHQRGKLFLSINLNPTDTRTIGCQALKHSRFVRVTV